MLKQQQQEQQHRQRPERAPFRAAHGGPGAPAAAPRAPCAAAAAEPQPAESSPRRRGCRCPRRRRRRRCRPSGLLGCISSRFGDARRRGGLRLGALGLGARPRPWAAAAGARAPSRRRLRATLLPRPPPPLALPSSLLSLVPSSLDWHSTTPLWAPSSAGRCRCRDEPGEALAPERSRSRESNTGFWEEVTGRSAICGRGMLRRAGAGGTMIFQAQACTAYGGGLGTEMSVIKE
jgi:hypothetical protein